MFPFLNEPVFKIVQEAAEQLRQNTYVVGGYVRDFLLHRTSKDIDFVTLGSGIQLAETVHQKVPESKLCVFKNFGTAQIIWNGYELEFVGARKESYTRNSRKPIVENGSLFDDLSRRDFTVNALAVSVNGPTYGQLIDLFSGLHDLNAGILKTPCDPDITFSDDPLRMLRAIRFATQLQFTIQDETLKSIEQQAGRIEIISMERIHEELHKIITAPFPSRGFTLLDETTLLKIIFPELHALKGTETINGKSHKDNFYHTLEVLDNLSQKTNSLWLLWAALLHDIAKPKTKRFEPGHGFTFHGHEDKGARMVPQIFKRLKLPLNEKMQYVQKLVQLHLRPIVLAKSEVTDSAVRRLLFEAGDAIDDLMLLCESDITTKNPLKVKRYLSNFALVRQKLIELEARDRIRNWQAPVSGEDIMFRYNLKPCKRIGLMKDALKDAILDGIIPNQVQEALDFLDSWHKQHPV